MLNSAMNVSMKQLPKADLRTPKPPKAPEKPLMPYMRYSRKVWERVKIENPQLKLWEVGRIIGQMWRELPDEEKNAYIEEYEAEKLPYSEALRQYHSSPAYQAWMVAKERAEKLDDECELDRKNQSRLREKHDPTPMDLRESYILEDNEEDPDEQFTVKHVAAARFQRNHRLMQEILSDSKLPNPGQLITKMRLHTLRMQVIQLNNHKSNLCSEIENCEFRHQTKMRRITDQSASFYADYRKLISTTPRITEAQFSDMIVKAKQDLAREAEVERERSLAEAEHRRCLEQQRQQRKTELLAAESEQRHQALLQQQQKRLTMHQTQYMQHEQQPHQQQTPNIGDEISQNKDASQREHMVPPDQNESSTSLQDPPQGYPGATRSRITGPTPMPPGDPTSRDFRQTPQQCVYPPTQVTIQRPDSRMQFYGTSRSQPFANFQRCYGNIPHPQSAYPQGPQSSMVAMPPNQPYPSPPQYSSVQTPVVTHTSFSQPLPVRMAQPSDNSDGSNLPLYPADSSQFYTSFKQSAPEFMQPSSRKDVISESILPPSEGGQAVGIASAKKKKKSAVLGKEKKVNQHDQQRSTVSSMEIDQNMQMGDRAPKSHPAKFPHGYFDEIPRQGSPGMLPPAGGQFQYQQQQPQQPSPRYINSQASMIHEGRIVGPSYIQSQNYYPSNAVQGFPQQIRPYQSQSGMYAGPQQQQQQQPSNYPNQQSQSAIYQHPSQAGSQLVHNQVTNPNSGAVNWHSQQQQQSLSQPTQQQPNPTPGSAGFSPQYGGQQNILRYSVPPSLGYQSRLAFQNQPNISDGINPQHQAGPAPPPPYHQAPMHHNYWPAQSQQQSLSNPMMHQVQEISSIGQFSGDAERHQSSSELPMRGPQQQQQQQQPASVPSIVSGHVNSSSGAYYHAYSSSQNAYGPPGPSNPQMSNYYVSSSPNINYEGQFYTQGQQGGVWNSYPTLQHEVVAPSGAPYVPAQPLSHSGQQRSMPMLQGDRPLPGMMQQQQQPPSHKQDMQAGSPVCGSGSRPESAAGVPGSGPAKSQSTTPNSNM